MLELYKFADFELDAARFELRRAGQVLSVQPKVLRLLLLLIKERERVVSTDELFRVLWPGERVGMTSIRRAMRGLRQALGESAESQHSVRTVRSFGYQFGLPVQVTSARPSTPEAPPTRPLDLDKPPLAMLGAADTLPLFGGAAKRLWEEAQRAWQARQSEP